MLEEVSGPPPAAHVAMPLAIGWLAGGLHASAGIGAAVAVVALALVAMRVGVRKTTRVGVAALAAGVACGALGAAVAQLPPPPDDVTRLAGSLASLEGEVVWSEGTAGRRALVVAIDHVGSRRRTGAARGLVAVTIAHAGRSWPVGQRLRLVGKIRRPRNFANPGAYDHVRTLARRGVRATLFAWDDAAIEPLGDVRTDDVRTRLGRRVAAVAGEPVRGYLTAVLLGATQSLAPATRDALTRAGLSHVVSVSGFHIAVAAGASVVLLRLGLLRVSPLALRFDVTKLAAALGVLPVAAYAALAGESVPAARSFLTYGVLLGALVCERPPDALRALAVVATMLAFAMPDVAADVSFELSFASVLALILVARRRRAAHASAQQPWWRQWIVDPVYVSIAATIATAPLTAWHFQQVSLVAPLANLVALPLLGPATLLPGLLALPVSFVAPALADRLLAIAAVAARTGLLVAEWFAAWPWAAITTPMPTPVEVALAYGALGLWWSRGALGKPMRRAAAGALMMLALLDVTYWTWERFGNSTLRITFVSVGQGDAAVVELPYGDVIVVDGGGLPGDFDPGARVLAPFLRARKILHVDALVMSHPQLDHYGGLAYLATAFGARELWCSGARGTGARFAALDDALHVAGTRVVRLRRGGRLLLASGVVVDVLHPDDPTRYDVNDASVVLRLRYGANAVLFTGDIERGAEQALLATDVDLRSDVLKVAHHGSATSSTAAWIAAVAPRVAVISTGADNRFGFPAPAVVARLRAAGSTVWNTAERGAIRVVLDGRDVSVVATRASAPERFEFPQLLW